MSPTIIKYKRLFFFVFWGILTVSVWPYIHLNSHPLYWLIDTVVVMLCFICIAHYLSDIALPKALREGRMKHFFLLFFVGILLLNVLISLCFTLSPYFLNDLQALEKANVSTYKR